MNAWFESRTGMRFEDPSFLWLALLIPAAVWFRRRRAPPMLLFAPFAFLADVPRSARQWLQPMPAILRTVALLLVVAAMARPVHRDPLPLVSEGIDLFLCLDASSSMAANDLDPRRTRLQVAREAALDFVSARAHDRLGLVRFARYPDLLCPSTLDHRAIRELLQELRMVEADGDEDLTGIGTALARCAQVLSASEARSRVVVLLTDGEENVAGSGHDGEIAPRDAAQLCVHAGIRVYTIVVGVGRLAADGRWEALDTKAVQHVAEATGGAFYQARDARTLEQVYSTIDQLERQSFEEPRYRLEERFVPFLVSALVLWWLGHLLRASALGVLP